MKRYLQERKRLICVFAPAFIGLLFLVLCFVNMDGSLSTSEATRAYMMRFSVGDIWNYAQVNHEAPLYFLILKAWAHFFGHASATLRALSAIAGAVSIIFVYHFLKYKYGATTAIIGALFFACSPILVHSGATIAPQALLILFVFASTYLLQLAIDNKSKLWHVLYVLAISVAIWLHFSAVLVALAHAVYLMTIYRKKARKNKTFLVFIVPVISVIVCAILCIGVPNGEASLSAIKLADLFALTFAYESAGALTGWLCALVVTTLIMTLIFALRYAQKMRMILTLILVPLASLIVGACLPTQIRIDSDFSSFSLVAVSLLLAVGLIFFVRDKSSRKKLNNFQKSCVIGLVIAIVVSCNIAGLSSALNKGNYEFENDSRKSNRSLFENIIVLDAGENLSIVADTPELYLELSNYTSEQHDVHIIDNETLLFEKDYFGKITNAEEFFASRRALWYVRLLPEAEENSVPFEGWRMTTEANLQFDTHDIKYQILKLERE